MPFEFGTTRIDRKSARVFRTVIGGWAVGARLVGHAGEWIVGPFPDKSEAQNLCDAISGRGGAGVLCVNWKEDD
jgi:hypothetical protein